MIKFFKTRSKGLDHYAVVVPYTSGIGACFSFTLVSPKWVAAVLEVPAA